MISRTDVSLVPGWANTKTTKFRGKARLGRITKAGDSYLRTLLVLGARSVLLGAAKNDDPVSRWALQLKKGEDMDERLLR